VDFSVHRGLALSERLRLRIGVDVFNLLNHPNFGDPNGLFGSITASRFSPNATFGVSQAMLGRNSTLGTGGLSSMYAPGRQRDVQLGLRLGF
jgi:hypothetical protein